MVIGKYLEGYNQDDKPPYPRSKIVAMFTEHVPKNDMSRPMAKKYGVPIFRTVQEALTLGGDKLAVDGVILIGEHGDYPVNDKAQTLYPSFRDVPQNHGCLPPERALRAGVQRQASLLQLAAGAAHGGDL